MENKNVISDEVRGISPLVAGIGNLPPYTVPPAYFDNLPVQLMLRIAIEEKAGADPILNINKNNVYQAPDSYFDNLADNILSRIKEQETGNAKEELELLSPLLGRAEKKNPFTSPDGYFNDFSDNVVAGVKAVAFVNEELENLSPLMLALKNKQVYEAPEGYFDTTAAIILNKAKQQRPATIISMGFSKKIMRYAAAAVVTGIIALSGYLYYSGTANQFAVNGSTKPLTLDSTGFARIPDQEIENFLNNNTVALADIGTETDSLNTTTVDAGSNTDDTKDLLADISDDELQKYVDQQSDTPLTN